MANIQATPQKVVAVARSYLGYLEKKSLHQLQSLKDNAGSKNITCFAADLDRLSDFYNGKKQGAPWCDVFVDACFVYAFGEEAARSLLCQPKKSLGAGCRYSAMYYEKKGQFHKSSPQVGDQIFFCSGETITHTGLVVQVDEKQVHTLEGNTYPAPGVASEGQGVFEKSYLLSDSRIYGYGRPNYADTFYEQPDVFSPLQQPMAYGCRGETVRALQILLTGRGYRGNMHTPDGIFGSNTRGAVKQYQKAMGLPETGIADESVWAMLLGTR